jgi:gliding motility-associated-like protein
MSNFISAFDLNGTCLWAKEILGTNNNTRFRRVDISENGYYFGGYLQGSLFLDIGTISSYVANTYDAFIYKTDFNGNGQWVRRIRGTGTENFRTLTTDEYDNVYVLGNFNSSTIYVDSTESQVKTVVGNNLEYDTFIGKYNRSGILQWFIRKGSSAKDIYNDFVVKNNVIYATGYIGNTVIFNKDTLKVTQSNISEVFLAAFNEIGNPLAGITIKGTDNDKVTAINNAGTIINMDASSRAYISGYYRSQQIQIGTQTYTSTNKNKSDLFFAIYQHPLEAVITRQENVSCNGLSDGLLQVTPYFGKALYTYTWSHDASLNSAVAANLPAGDYTVTVRDANNLVATIPATITEPPPLAVNAVITPVTCYNLNTGAIDITVTGGTPNYVYSWSTITGSGVTLQNQDQTGLTEGTYYLSIEDDNQCTLSTDFIVTEPSKLRFTGSTTSNLTFPPGNNGAIDLQIAGGNTPYGTLWTGPSGFTSALEDLTGLTEGGLYSVALTDSKNCLADTSLAVNDGTTLIAQVIAKTPVLCFGDDNGSAEISVLNGIPPFSYQWSDGLTTALATRTNMAPGTYQVLVSDAALPVSHNAQAEVAIDGPSQALSTQIISTNLSCYQDSTGQIELVVTGGTLPYNFDWNTGYKGEDLGNVPSGSYSVTVTDTNNCLTQDNTTITEPAAIGLDITQDTHILCNGENTASVTANVTGGSGVFSYLWDDPGTQVTKTAVQLFAGNLTVTVTDQNDCSISESVLIEQPDSISVSTLITEPSCPGDNDAALVPTVSGGTPIYDFAWSNNVFQRINSNIPAGTYALTITDINNCSLSDTFVVNDPLPVVINQLDSTDASCFGVADGSIHIDATGGTGSLSYSADNGLNFISSPDIGSLPAALYTVVVRDSNDCASATRTIAVDQPTEITFDTVLVTDASCYGYTDGAVEILALGGTGVFEYSADNGGSFVPSPTIASLMNGTYQLVIKDDANCLSAIRLANVGPDEEFSVDTIEVVRGSVNNPLGSITLENTGGISPVSFVIIPDSSSNTSGVFSDLVAQNYRVFAIDDSLCKSNELLVSLPEAETDIVIYDAFSPNDDGKNDVWNIPGIGNYPNCSVKIFNTWGVAIFTSKGYGIPWDGKYKGNDLPSGTYYYVIDPGDGSGELSGPVSLVK